MTRKSNTKQALSAPIDPLEGHRLAVSSVNRAIIERKRHLHRCVKVSLISIPTHCQSSCSLSAFHMHQSTHLACPCAVRPVQMQ